MDDESLPGGNKWPFMASHVLRLTSGKEFKKDKDYKISGRVTNVSFLKSRTGFNSVKLPLFLHGTYGFSNAITNLMIFKDANMLKGSGHGYFFKGYEDFKFKLGEFSKRYNEDPEFQEMFDEVSAKYWQTQLLEKVGLEDESATSDNDFESFDEEDDD